jgi:hypothetical protein
MEDLNHPAISSALMLQQPNVDPMLPAGGIVASPFNFDSLQTTPMTAAVVLQQQQQQQQQNNSIIRPTNNPQTPAMAMITINGVLGGYPIQLLLMITRLSKILAVKRENVRKLSEMNLNAERARATDSPLTKEFQMNYAMLVLDLERLNKDLSEYLSGVQRFCEEYSSDYFRVVNINSKNELVVMSEENDGVLCDSSSSSSSSSSHESSSNSSSPTNVNEQQTSSLISDMRANYMRESARLVSKKNRKRCANKSEPASELDEEQEEENCDDSTEEEEENDGKIEHNLNRINLNGGTNGKRTAAAAAGVDSENSDKVSEVRIKSKRSLDLIVRLTSLLLQLKDFVNATNRGGGGGGDFDTNSDSPRASSATQFLPFCTRSINESISEIKQSLSGKESVELFEDRIQVHINHVQSVLCQYNKLHAFKHELDH